jgi:hypothetical protein
MKYALRFALFASLAGVLACPKDKEKPPVDTVPTVKADTPPTDLSNLQSNIPAAEPDTHTAPKLPTAEPGQAAPAIPMAPDALMEVVNRETSQSVTRFCFTERGLKQDPTLRGAVTMVVTVARAGITDAKVEADRWTSNIGKQVNACLNEKTKDAWKLSPGLVRAGKYQVPLRFTGG